jgi:ribosome biogenesis GTPase / thiamine phosphate phosphatase
VTRLARIAVDDGVAYVAWLEGGGEQSVRLAGRMLREVRAGRAARPVVGDWVEVSSDGIVVTLRPRRTRLARKAAGLRDVEQVIVANVDVAFVATAIDGDVNERRLERYLALVHEGGVVPIVLLTKADVPADLEAETARVRSVAADVEILVVSARTGQGLDELARRIAPGSVAVLLGSSGVGKSTLVNSLLGEAQQRIGALRDDGKGRHTTTRRELFVLPNGGLLFDTPGMRELGLIDAGGGVEEAFADVAELAARCHFRDCSHGSEPGCAVREALERGEIDPVRLESWRKLTGEIEGRRRRR